MNGWDTGGAHRYGFTWGPADVTRISHVKGRGGVIEVATEHARIQIHVTEAGRKINVYRLDPYPITEEDE